DWLFYSSVAVLGSSDAVLTERSPLAPRDAYGKSKAEAEKLFWQRAVEDRTARIMIIRPSVVFGPGNPPNTNIYRLIESLHKNRFFMVGKGDGVKTTQSLE